MANDQIQERSGAAAVHSRPMIVARNAHVTYKVYAGGKPVGAKSKMFGQRGGIVNSVTALRGVSFTASEGETIGVVGHNGSGKSTLFRAMAGLIPTTEGSIRAADRPVLLGVNAALMPELSGESNIKLGLLAMGFTPEQADAHVDEIADFAELNEFISHPMRTYSSGMGARLRFAIASARPHSILLLDEALAVGDRRFRVKSENRIRELRDAAGLVMIVSHSASSLKDTCERGLWIHKGELRADGDIKDVVDEYTKWTKDPTSVAVGAASKSTVAAPPSLTPPTTAVGTVATTTIAPRAAARRARFHEATRERARRRSIAIALTGAAVVVAVGAGAAVALVTRQSDRIEIDELRTAASTSPSATPELPVINSFTAPATAPCQSIDTVVEVGLSWDVSHAASVALSVAGADGAPVPVLDAYHPVASSQAVIFSCAEESQTYTLSTRNENGQEVASTVVVMRDLAPAPEDEAVDQPVPEESVEIPAPEAPTDPPVAPPDPTDPPVEPTDPPVEPTTPPVEPTDPPVDPPAEPEPPVDATDPPPGTP